MEQLKITTGSSKDDPVRLQGQVCSLPGKGGIGSAKGAMGSAVATIIL